MKLIMAVINNSDVKEVTKAMMEGGFYVTKIGSSGGILKGRVTTLISCVHDERRLDALEIIRKSTHSRKYQLTQQSIESGYTSPVGSEIVVGGATVFVMDVKETYKY